MKEFVDIYLDSILYTQEVLAELDDDEKAILLED